MGVIWMSNYQQWWTNIRRLLKRSCRWTSRGTKSYKEEQQKRWGAEFFLGEKERKVTLGDKTLFPSLSLSLALVLVGNLETNIFFLPMCYRFSLFSLVYRFQQGVPGNCRFLVISSTLLIYSSLYNACLFFFYWTWTLSLEVFRVGREEALLTTTQFLCPTSLSVIHSLDSPF